ncbi:LysR family transcriptional regulator, glycine cleavage system transcriptional activator [Neptunomonas antarctica]|uniref:LysR family transcriptional regulator, glycine cleavage system transcriptional activator n=2 Tax=Neptunomonas antarctica TaxID=619304 RepID=A0A1N7K2G5_9GAMM|nr:LysR family transcriptional regulator, glycine cleavage system transcriptional activator [Neptunomonas antarctica]
MFNRLPSLTSIKVFETAARLKSFKDAADELSVSPTAVSHQIKSLEDALKIKLFLRHTRSVSLTHEGELLATTANRVLRELMHTINEITTSPDTLHIGTTNSFAAMWLVPNLEDFQNNNSDIDVQINADDNLYDVDNDRRIDMVIRYGKFKDQPGAELLIHESPGCFATPTYWQQLASTDCWTFLCTKWKNQSLPEQNVEQLLNKLIPGNKQFIIRSFNDENQVIQAALTGQGIAIIDEILVQNSLSNGWLLRGFEEVSSALAGLDYYCIIPERNRHNKATLYFVSWLRNKITSDIKH